MQLELLSSMKLILILSHQVLLSLAASVQAPSGGAPFLVDSPLGSLPSQDTDGKDAVMQIFRLNHGKEDSGSTASPHVCDMGDQADKKKCLSVPSRGCMWTRVQTQDPFKRVQAANSYCLPCKLENEEIPCWNVGAWVDGKQVTDCVMSCDHQQQIYQQNYACSDDTGFISQSQCFSRAAVSGSKCMFLTFEEKGETKSSCAPCELRGTGGWGCPPVGAPGPTDGSTVKSCLSQCDVLCTGPPACPPTVAPPPPPPPPSPGLGKVSAPEDQMLSAPAPWPVPTVNPYMIIQSARDAAEKAGFQTATTPLPKVYWPVVYYRSPSDFLYTTGPPPVEGPEPPATFLQSMFAPRSTQTRDSFLARLKRHALAER